ncbi:MAG: dTDP-glucose 4,6-dehydratase [Candidatus Tectomicrobia bacterium]|uniref:dTDP-glucose 4,6-dehydratase n=1 Tax=Tectimicrobiota bacterium TaxID=2528274 RepID=A0A932LYT0_UNCTE|nr:dTDP-glucose 4,6-dehydratase [Candidatus Tectomicrobia bacterium]
MKVLVTGGAGFIGSNFIRFLVRNHPDCDVINLDKLTYAGNLENLSDLETVAQYRFVKGDIADKKLVGRVFQEAPDAVVNFAAESHVDRSILKADQFVKTNVLGIQVLLECARTAGTQRFIQVSTDEVYGSAASGETFSEESSMHPNSPYAASKAAADLLARAYYHTYGFPVIITRCTNNYGPYQFPEKLLPLMITNALADQPLPVYGDGYNVRDWIHVEDHCAALDRVLHQGRLGEIYNIGSHCEKTNLEMVKELLGILNKPQSLVRFVKDRPGHDRRYALNVSKIQRELGWRHQISLGDGLRQTVAWYSCHREWWERVKRGEYRKYYKKVYGRIS